MSSRTTAGPAGRPLRRRRGSGAAAAMALYERFCGTLSALGLRVERGTFRARMNVHSINDGPVCILLDSKRVF